MVVEYRLEDVDARNQVSQSQHLHLRHQRLHHHHQLPHLLQRRQLHRRRFGQQYHPRHFQIRIRYRLQIHAQLIRKLVVEKTLEIPLYDMYYWYRFDIREENLLVANERQMITEMMSKNAHENVRDRMIVNCY